MASFVTTAPDDREELRLALVLNGGVSLAIWIGGVVMEINRLLRGEGAYGEILELTQSVARVDVIAGASAGGINGALLATAIAHAEQLEPLRDVWLDDGDLGMLLRDPYQRDPPSLLRGDEYFLERLRSVFRGLARSSVTPPDDYPVDLTITNTMLTPERVDFDDDFGTTIGDAMFRGQFHFRREAGGTDDFATEADADRIALAARSTASFPGAFEASFVPIGRSTADPPRPNMDGVTSFSSSRFTIDGGVLVNKPIRPVLRTIFGQPAARQVRRVLGYVVPDPGFLPPVSEATEDDAPTLAQVLAKTVLLPRQESIALDLEDLVDHNKRVGTQRRIRELLLGDEGRAMVDFRTLADLLYPAYRDARIVNTVDYILDQLTIGTRRLEQDRRARGSGTDLWIRNDLKEALATAIAAVLSPGLPSDDSPAGWLWDVRTVEVLGVIALDLMKQAMYLALPDAEPPWQGIRQSIRDARRRLHVALGRLSEVRQADIRYWQGRGDAFAGTAALDAESTQAVEGWLRNTLEPLPEIAGDVAATVVEVGPVLWSVAKLEPTTEAGYLERFRNKLIGLAVPEEPGGDMRECWRRLLAMSIVQLALTGGLSVVEQTVQLAQFTAYCPNGFDGRATATDKLAGVQLGHFGAFYKRSWRANDWMWGRLDGADRLIQIALHPDRLRRLARVRGEERGRLVDDVVSLVERLSLGTDPDAAAVLGAYWDRDEAAAELAFLEEPDLPTPPRLPYCGASVARRIQLGILTDELPSIGAAIREDEKAGAAVQPSARRFAEGVAQAQRVAEAANHPAIAPVAAVDLFKRCDVGRERIAGEVGTDLFTTIATKAAAVGVSAASGQRSGTPGLRTVLGSIRGAVLTLYLLTRSAIGSSKTDFATLIVLLATGGAILAVSLPGDRDLPGWLSTLGIVLVLAGLVLLTLRAGALWAVGVIVATAALAIGPFVVLRYHLGQEPLSGWRAAGRSLAPAVPILALILGCLALGLITRGSHRRRPLTSPRRTYDG
jgi:patatin-related protein